MTRNRFAPNWAPTGWHATCGLLDLCNFISKTISARDSLKLVEIGSDLGESTCIFAGYGIFDKVYAIDPWFDQERHDIFLKNSKIYPDIITPMKMVSREAAANWSNGDVDTIYIDANHNYEYVLSDIDSWSKKVKKGGIIAGHDYSKKRWPGVYAAVNECFESQKIKVFCDTSWAVIAE
jgi:predicted O-methyltransferase YrrM